jgi:hypothetical protein
MRTRQLTRLGIIANGLEACGWDVPPDPGPEAFAAPQ